MGTHPIFESDFDCLTEMIVRCSKLVSASSQLVCRLSARQVHFRVRPLSSPSRPSIVILSQRGAKDNRAEKEKIKEFEELDKFNSHETIWQKIKNEERIPTSWIIAVIATFWIYLYFGVWFTSSYKEEQERMQKEQDGWSNHQNLDIGKGDWTLIDCKTKMPITKQDLEGKWIIMYFGFCHCPDICPETMEKVMDVCDIHEKERKANPTLPPIQPVFITIDPDRDTPENLAYYLQDYPHFLGLTGSMSDIKSVTKNYRIYFTKGPTSDEGDYMLDHSIIIYLINPNSVYQNRFMERAQPPEEIYSVIRQQF